MAGILIIDDDPLVIDSFRQVIEKMGHQAAAASSIAEALKIVRSQGFDIVFCDVRMPDGSGLDILLPVQTIIRHD